MVPPTSFYVEDVLFRKHHYRYRIPKLEILTTCCCLLWLNYPIFSRFIRREYPALPPPISRFCRGHTMDLQNKLPARVRVGPSRCRLCVDFINFVGKRIQLRESCTLAELYCTCRLTSRRRVDSKLSISFEEDRGYHFLRCRGGTARHPMPPSRRSINLQRDLAWNETHFCNWAKVEALKTDDPTMCRGSICPPCGATRNVDDSTY